MCNHRVEDLEVIFHEFYLHPNYKKTSMCIELKCNECNKFFIIKEGAYFITKKYIKEIFCGIYNDYYKSVTGRNIEEDVKDIEIKNPNLFRLLYGNLIQNTLFKKEIRLESLASIENEYNMLEVPKELR